MKVKLIIIIIISSLFTGCKTKHEITGKINNGVDSTLTNTYEIEYDFITGVYNRNMNRLKVNTPVIFKISNINRLAYNVEITSKDSAVAVSMGLPDETTEKIEKIENTVDNQSSRQVMSSTISSFNNLSLTPADLNLANSNQLNRYEDLKKEKKILLNEFADLNFSISNTDNLMNSQKELLNRKDEMKLIKLDDVNKKLSQQLESNNDSLHNYKIKTLQSNIKAIEENYEKDKTAIDDNVKNLNEKLTSLITERKKVLEKIAANEVETETFKNRENAVYFDLKNEYDQYNKLYNEYLNFYSSIRKISIYQQTMLLAINNPYLNYNRFKEFCVKYKIEDVKVNLDVIENELYTLKDLFSQTKNKYHRIKNIDISNLSNNNAIKSIIIPLDIQNTYLDNINTELDKLEVGKLVSSLENSIRLLENEETYTVKSSPVQPTQDLVQFNIDITHKNTEEKINNTKKFNHKEFTYGGVRLDAGIGFAITYLHNTPQYDLIEKDGKYTIGLDKKHYYSSSLLLLFTATYRSTRYVAWGASAGLGINLGENDSTLQLNNYYVGPTAMFGKTNRFAITAGMAIKQVDKLKVGYDLGGNVDNKDVAYTSKDFRFGPFLSITYNLTKGVKDNVKFVRSFF